MGIKDFASKIVEKQKESNRKIKDSFSEANEKNDARIEKNNKRIEELKNKGIEREKKYKEQQELFKIKQNENKERMKSSLVNIKQAGEILKCSDDSKRKEKERRKEEKESEKEEKRKEFERIMASTPEVSIKPKSNIAKRTEVENVVRCPKCGSTQITANKRGFSLGKAAIGTVATLGSLGVGAVSGVVGKNKIIVTCLSCGKQFKPGK